MSEQPGDRPQSPATDGAAAQPPGPGPADRPEIPAAPVTGDPVVDEAVSRLAGILDREPGEQLSVYESVHRALQDRLADVEG